MLMLSDPMFWLILAALFLALFVGGRLERRRQRLAALPPPASLREEIHNVMWGGQARWQLRALGAIPGLIILAVVLLVS